MIEKGIPSKLWKLSKSVKKKVKEYEKSGKAIKTKNLFIKSKVTTFDYEQGATNYSLSYENIPKEEWDIKDQFDFMEKTIHNLPEYKEIQSEISKKYGVTESQAEFWLSRFVQILTHKILEGVKDDFLIDYLTTFIGDLEKSPIKWTMSHWVDGVWLEDEEYEIYEGFKVRRPNPSDLEHEIPFSMLPTPLGGILKMSSAVLELSQRAKDQSAVQNEMEKVLNCLRLFKLGSVHTIRSEILAESILSTGMRISPGYRFSTHYKYGIAKNDVEKLKNMIEIIKPLLPEKENAKPDQVDPLDIALERYNGALLKSESIESRITSAITCFEALYLKAEERMELTHRLSQRASALLKFFGFIPLEVYKSLVRAYDIRSRYIHGSPIKKEEQSSANKLAENCLEYARTSILVYLQLEAKMDKIMLINKIDNSLLDHAAASKLKITIDENCTIS